MFVFKRITLVYFCICMAALLTMTIGSSAQLASTDVPNIIRIEHKLRLLGLDPQTDLIPSPMTQEGWEVLLPPFHARSSLWEWASELRSQMLFQPLSPQPLSVDLTQRGMGVLRGVTPPQSPAWEFWFSAPAYTRENTSDRLPLRHPNQKLRVALDPGHMGGPVWDDFTGKFIRESLEPGSRRLSEGELALQVALLLRERLERHGIEVLLTRESLESPSAIQIQDLNLQKWGRQAILARAWTPWFDALDAASAAGDVFFQKLFSEEFRKSYFLNGEDLRARAEKIEAFEPDLAVIIHFDISEPKPEDLEIKDAGLSSVEVKPDPNGLNPKLRSTTKAYVSGAFFPNEFSTREDRAWFAYHALNRGLRRASRNLARHLTHALSRELGIGFDPNNLGNSIELEPGVYARNLYLTRKLTMPSAYVETLHYNAPNEFAALYPSSENIVGKIAGFSYTERMVRIVDAYESGIIAYLAAE